MTVAGGLVQSGQEGERTSVVIRHKEQRAVPSGTRPYL